MKPGTRVFLTHIKGTRTTENYVALFSDVEHKRWLQSPLPVFTSDNWDPSKDALLRVYGVLEQPPYKGRGRKSFPRLVPPDELKYAQVCKKQKKGRLVEVVQQVVLGDSEEVMMLLGADQGGSINTALWKG
ncbi:MAG: hypothetical protein NT038_02955 [Euryarchaeota archaeon]|nr:hypothetical protein [Euryarchaeota archaeon]